MSGDRPEGAALASFGAERRVLGEWTVTGVTGLLAGGVSVWLERSRDGATLQVVVAARGSRALVETPLGSVLYHKHTGLTDREAGDTTRAFAALLERGDFRLGALFPHLMLGQRPDEAAKARVLQLAGAQLKALPGPGGASLPEAKRELFFDPPGVAEFLAPELVVEGPGLAGYSLRAIYLPAVGKRAAQEFRHYVLEFVDVATAESVRLGIGAGSSGESFGRAGELSLSVLGFTQDLDALPPRVASLCSWVLALVQLKSDDSLRVRVPADASELRAMAHPPERGWASSPEAKGTSADTATPPSSLNLAIDTECGQRCAFCSVKAYVRPLDEGAVALDRIRVQLRMARDQGVREVRLNGIDPLTFSRVLEVLDAVLECGFPKLSVYSPCRRLADPDFRREFLRRMPPEFVISVPLYGVTAAAHEAVTNTPGSFAEVRAALDGLLAETPPDRGHVVISTVVVKQNLAEFPAVVAFARERGLGVHPHLPYPMRQTTRDPYADSALRERDLVEHFVDHLPTEAGDALTWSLGVLGSAVPHPCLLWQAERKRRLPVFGARTIDDRQALAGTEYRSRKILHDTQGAQSQDNAFAVATVPCPHVERCALAPVCPGEHYSVYRDLYGLDEFAPVRVADLYAAAPQGVVPAIRATARDFG